MELKCLMLLVLLLVINIGLQSALVQAETLAAGEIYARTVTNGAPLDFDYDIPDDNPEEMTVFVASCEPEHLTLTVSGTPISSPTFQDFFIQKKVKAQHTLTFSVQTTETSVPFHILVASSTKANTANVVTEQTIVYLIPNVTVSNNITAAVSYFRLEDDSCNSVTSDTRRVGQDDNNAFIINGFSANQTVSAATFAFDLTGNLITLPPVEAQTQVLDCTLPVGLSFCDIEYAVPGTPSEIAALDTEAKDLYTMFLQVMSQYNCWDEQIRYSFMVTCSDCRVAYKNWLCRKKFNMCVPYEAQPELTGNNRYYELPCWSLCYTTLQSCPYDLGFECPLDTRFESFTRSYKTCPTDYGYNHALRILPSPFASVFMVLALAVAAIFL